MVELERPEGLVEIKERDEENEVVLVEWVNDDGQVWRAWVSSADLEEVTIH